MRTILQHFSPVGKPDIELPPKQRLIAIILHLEMVLLYNVAMTEVGKALKVLRRHGYRITTPRRQVLRVLAEAQCPLSPYEIQGLLEQRGEHLNHVTIYRVLELLCSLNLAHKVLLAGGFVICSLEDIEGCHRFIVCKECGMLKEYASKTLCAEETEVAQRLGFRSEQHFSEFSGVCARCQK